jgi:hypothetical protein
MSSKNAIADAFGRIETWMKRKAPLLAENLAPGASETDLDAFEMGLGCRLPPDLRLLWSIHNGQREEENGFYGALDFASMKLARIDRSALDQPLEFLRRNTRADLEESGVTDAELASDKWIRLAGRDYDAIAVNAESGRVFDVVKNTPPFALLANSVEEWIVSYAAAITAEEYEVQAGFGDYYLQRRNHADEQREEAARRARKVETQRRAATPATDLLREAIAKKSSDLSAEVIGNAQKDSVAHAEVIALLFSGLAAPRFVAETLRTMLSTLSLSAEQWLVVSEGGAQLKNNAIRDIALKKARAVEAEQGKA